MAIFGAGIFLFKGVPVFFGCFEKAYLPAK